MNFLRRLFPKKEEKKLFYTELIKFIAENQIEGVSLRQIYDFAVKMKFINPEDVENLINKKLATDNPLAMKQRAIANLIDEITYYKLSDYYMLKAEFFVYLKELEELEFATKNAKEARRFSIAAIIISLASILVAYFNPIEINNTQFNELKDEISKSKYKDEKVIESINNLKKEIDSLTIINSKLLPKQDKK